MNRTLANAALLGSVSIFALTGNAHADAIMEFETFNFDNASTTIGQTTAT